MLERKKTSFMIDVSEQVTALIKELLILNREETSLTLRPQTAKQTERQRSKRKSIRQALVQVLSLRDRKNFRPRI
jgi:hypothetical protein